MELFKRMMIKRKESIENQIRFIKSKSSVTEYDIGMLTILEEELSCRIVELGLLDEHRVMQTYSTKTEGGHI